MIDSLGADLDPTNLTGLGIGAILLALVFRTLWKQEGGWRAILEAARADAKQARTDAADARTDAAEARADARAARADAAEARNAEARCQADLGKIARRFDDLLEASEKRTTRRVAHLEELTSGEIPRTDPPDA